MIRASIGFAPLEGKSNDRFQHRLAHILRGHCRICSLTALGHGVLPIAGSILAFVVLVFACR